MFIYIRYSEYTHRLVNKVSDIEGQVVACAGEFAHCLPRVVVLKKLSVFDSFEMADHAQDKPEHAKKTLRKRTITSSLRAYRERKSAYKIMDNLGSKPEGDLTGDQRASLKWAKGGGQEGQRAQARGRVCHPLRRQDCH